MFRKAQRNRKQEGRIGAGSCGVARCIIPARVSVFSISGHANGFRMAAARVIESGVPNEYSSGDIVRPMYKSGL